MKLLALTDGPQHVCHRYRVAPFADALAELGWTLESLPLSAHTLERRAQLRAAGAADAVLLQRKLLPLWQISLLRRHVGTLIYDFDDALFCRDSYSRKGPNSWMRLTHFWATVYASDGVFAGNPYLAQQTAHYIEPERIHCLPTCVEPRLYPLARHERHGRAVRLVWIGQHSTLPGLYQAEPHLAAAGERLPGLRLRVICNRFPQLMGIRVIPRPWSMASEASEIADADIGLSWLPNDAWSRGKCGLKVLQYMAAGLPVVANPVGMNAEMVRHGETGLLASTPVEWADAIERLAHDRDLRHRLGTAGRERVERDYSIARWAPEFAQLVDRIARRSTTNPREPLARISA